MSGDPRELYTAAQVRELDRRAIEDHGIGAYALMQRAGAAAFRLLRLRWPGARRVAVLCGGGNNGGDGIVVACLARAAGLDVALALARPPAELRGAAAEAWADWDAGGDAWQALEAADPASADVVVDALLGTGLDRPVAGAIADAIARINASGRPALALDIPSGLAADRGAVLGDAVRADATITFIGAKRGLYTAAAPDCTGPVFLDDLDVPAAVYADAGAPVRRLEAAWASARLPRRACAAHKGHAGRLLVVGGDHGFAGAARMAGEAALRVGAGLVTVATRAEHVPGLVAARPELMGRALADPAAELPALAADADAVALGPGLGRGDWGREALAALLQQACPLVLDADALNALADAPRRLPAAAVITPHPGEAARLLGRTTAAVQEDRFDALVALQQRFGAVTVLKGAGTLVAPVDDGTMLLALAQPAMAAGGMGDVLTGAIGGLVAQGMEPAAAAACGVWLHGAAAARAVRRTGVVALLPGDLGPDLAALRARPVDG